MKHKQRKPILLLMVGITLFMTGCSNDNHKATNNNNAKPTAILVVKKSPFTESFFYRGIVQPIHKRTVTSPADGFIQKKNFEYGQAVKKGQRLVMIKSKKLEADYQAVLTEFLKAKDAYQLSEKNFIGLKRLWQLGIIARNEFMTAKSNLDKAHVDYLQSLYKLKETMRIGKRKAENLTKLNLSDIEQVNRALNFNYSTLTINVPNDGMALLPPNTNSDSENAGVEVGSQIVLGQGLVTIGDLSGITVTIKVNEMDINEIKQGDKAMLTSAAFPGLTLKGYVKSVSTQTQNNQNSMNQLPTFPVSIVVPHLTSAQLKAVHVGMSAFVTIKHTTPNTILIPLDAVTTDEMDHTFVTVKKGDRFIKQSIVTGKTTLNRVIVKKGLVPGDNIVIGHQAPQAT